MKDKHLIVGVHITDRLAEAVEVQKHLTANGHLIKTRLGLHEISDGSGAPNGILLLELVGEEANADKLVAELTAIEGVEAKKMTFDHPA
jgi:hypothetical protein